MSKAGKIIKKWELSKSSGVLIKRGIGPRNEYITGEEPSNISKHTIRRKGYHEIKLLDRTHPEGNKLIGYVHHYYDKLTGKSTKKFHAKLVDSQYGPKEFNSRDAALDYLIYLHKKS